MSKVDLRHGDSREVLKAVADASIDSCVTDPPYALVSIQKRFGKPGSAPAASEGASGVYKRASAGFMGQQWDTGETAFDPDFWAEVFRVLKPGAHLLAFSGTRTYHRLATAIEDAGFEIRDCIFYCYGSGFPKSHNVTKKLFGVICDCGSASVSQYDVRRMQRDDVSKAECVKDEQGKTLQQGLQEQSVSAASLQCATSAARPGKSVLEIGRDPEATEGELQRRSLCQSAGLGEADGSQGRIHHGASASDGADVRVSADANGSRESHRPQSEQQPSEQSGTISDERRPQASGAWPLCRGCGKPIIPEGLGTALKPAVEPICVARKPLIGTVAANVMAHGTGALNVDGCRVGWQSEADAAAAAAAVGFAESRAKGTATQSVSIGKESRDGVNRYHPDQLKGRWPANLVHDGSPEVMACFPETQSGKMAAGVTRDNRRGWSGDMPTQTGAETFGDSGSAARFFYTAKADASDRLGSKHPTVKPVDLMRWLVRLVTPPGGLVLDPFAGSGTTGMACMAEGFRSLLIEREAGYVADIRRRIDHVSGADAPLFANKGAA